MLSLALVLALAGTGDLDPATYRSPSGRFELRVDPNHRSGAGPAQYELREGSRIVWKGERPFAYWSAVVADDGSAFGYAYSQGTGWFSDGDFLVATFAPDGAVRHVERTKQEGSRFLHTSPDPKSNGIVVQSALRRAVVRIADPDLNRAVEAWWVYDLATGERVATLEPSWKLPHPESLRYVVRACEIRGTPLVLAQWWRYESSSRKSLCGGTFALVDPEGSPVWHLTLPEDYTIPGDEEARDRLQDEVSERGMVLRADEPRAFTLRFVREGVAARFAVEEAPDAKEKWRVRETGRTPWRPAAESRPADPRGALLAAPELALQELGRIELRGARDRSEGAPIVAWSVDDRGWVGIVRARRAEGAPLRVEFLDGERRVEVSLPGSEATAGESHLCSLRGRRWLAIVSPYGVGARASGWWIEPEARRATRIEDLGIEQVKAIGAAPDGGFAILEEHRFRYTATVEVVRFGADGKVLWRTPGSTGHDQQFLVSHGLAFLGSGEVAVLDTHGSQGPALVLIGDGGRPTRDLPVPEDLLQGGADVWARLAADASGGVVLHSTRNDGDRFARIGANGACSRPVRARHPDGRFVDTAHGLAVDAKGTIWVSDGVALYALGEDGTVERALGGAPPSGETLGGVNALALDANDRIYAFDARAKAVHVFDRGGRRLEVRRIGAEDAERIENFNGFSVAPDGRIHFALEGSNVPLSGGHAWLEEGGALQRRPWKTVDPVSETLAWQPSNRHWILGYELLALADDSGEIVASTERAPSGRWLKNLDGYAVAPDGSLALLQSEGLWNSRDPKGVGIHLFDPSARPLRTLPRPGWLGWHPSVAFDGARLFILDTPNGAQGCVAVLDTEKGSLLARVPLALGGPPQGLFLAAGSRELWIPIVGDAIVRLALPSEWR